MKTTLSFAFLLILSFSYAQKSNKFNLGFELQNELEKLSQGWMQWGEYPVKIDSISFSEKKAGKIVSNNFGNSFGSIAYAIPAKYVGKVIKLEGYMKIENVSNGTAGLLLRVDGNDGILAFDNMQSENINGTKDWQKYSITLDYNEEAKMIYVAGILSGTGTAWFDDFKVTLDGKDIQSLKEVEAILPKALLDTEFDEGSQISLSNLSNENIEQLDLLGRVWGFLKYYQRDIAAGEYNMDYELFRFLPKYMAAEDDQSRNKLLADWIEYFGSYHVCLTCKYNKKAQIQPDLKWIDPLTDELKEKLLRIHAFRAVGDHYYYEMAKGVGNPKFKHDNLYQNMPFPDDGFRLLAVYRYWNIIHSFFPYKHLMDKDWNLVLKEFIPRVLTAKNEFEYEMVMLEMIARVQDTHANLWGGADKIKEWKGSNYPPVHVQFVEGQLVVTDFYNIELKDETGLEIGDVITTINGKSTKQIIEEKVRYYPASNHPTFLRDLAEDILRSNDKSIEIDFISAGKAEESKTLKLYPKESINDYRWNKPSSEKSYKMLDNNIGYITLQTIRDEDVAQIKKQFKKTKGIIIDIRNYPSTFVPFSLGSFFVTSRTPFAKFTKGNPDNPGEFSFSKEVKIRCKGRPYKGKVIVLLNELSQSQAEYTAMAFRAGRNTTIVGSTTAAADGNISRIHLPGGLSTMISGIGVYYPDGTETQRVGIVPDVEVKPTIEGIRKGEDELMTKAIELILAQ